MECGTFYTLEEVTASLPLLKPGAGHENITLMSILRRDYHVRDNTGDVWTVETLPTWKQANDFRNMIKNQLNRDLTLIITSTPRPEKQKAQVPSREKPLPLFVDSEF